MTEKSVIIYISENNKQCKKLLNQMEEWNVSYETRNITRNHDYKKELQDMDLYGTPATFINNDPTAILGFQKNKIKASLEL